MQLISHHCGATWTGTAACHCAGCHRTWSSMSAFTRHRRKPTCLDPATTRNEQGDTVFELRRHLRPSPAQVRYHRGQATP